MYFVWDVVVFIVIWSGDNPAYLTKKNLLCSEWNVCSYVGQKRIYPSLKGCLFSLWLVTLDLWVLLSSLHIPDCVEKSLLIYFQV